MDIFDTFDTLKELILSVNDIDILVLLVDSNAEGSDSLVGGVDDVSESRRKAGQRPSLADCPSTCTGREALLAFAQHCSLKLAW